MRVHAPGKIGERAEGALAALLEDGPGRRLADPLDGGQAEADRRPGRGELLPRLVDVRRQHEDAAFQAVPDDFHDPVGGADLGRQRRREEVDRVVRLQIRRLVGQQRVGHGVRLVEPVPAERLDQTAELLRFLLGDAVLDRLANELLDVGEHDLHVFLADPLAQQVRLGHGIARHARRDAHDLFLVDEDPQSLLQDVGDLGQRIRDGVRAVASPDVLFDHADVQGAGTEEGVQDREIGENAGLRPPQQVPHPRGVELEDARGPARAEELIGLLVV